jgi:glucosyl-3-phosphoglycerate synthase
MPALRGELSDHPRDALNVMGPRRFHHTEFTDAARLLELKRAGGNRISVCIPTLDEAATIGSIVRTITEYLMGEVPLVDEVVVIDSGSADATRRLAAEAGARVFLSSEIRPETGTQVGKGENLWKALHAAEGDLICYVDGDIANFHPRFVTGLVGPLLGDQGTDYVKAYYKRPLGNGDALQANGGGRVSEILVRPLISLFYPELSGVLQPLSGEYAGRRSLLESLAFPTGYGVEIAHLIDLSAAGLLDRIAQTDLEQRIHRNRDEPGLGRMAFAILRTFFRRLERDGKLGLGSPLPELHRSWLFEGAEPEELLSMIAEPERPPVGAPAIRASQPVPPQRLSR